MQDRVHFRGAIGHADGLVEIYQQGDIVVIPSIWDEPFGMPVTEAMATGAPVIATQVGGSFPNWLRTA